MADTTIAAAAPMWLEVSKALGPSVAVALAAGLGYLLLRRQEQVKRQEEVAAGVRRLQLDALADVLQAIGRYVTALEAHRSAPELSTSPSPEQTSKNRNELRQKVIDAYEAAEVVLAGKAPLLSGGSFDVIDARFKELWESRSTTETFAIMGRMDSEIAPWIPPLEPVREPRKAGPTVGPWPVAFLMLWAAVLYALIVR